MNIQEFAAKIRLHPCASVRVGRVMDREKSTGEAKVKFSGLQPHYATAGCPMVEWAGDRPLPFDNGAQVEFHFEEDQTASFPGMERGSWIPYSALRKGTLVQLTYGRQGVAPTLGAYRVLREAGFRSADQGFGQKVFLVSYGWLSPGSMGSVVGEPPAEIFSSRASPSSSLRRPWTTASSSRRGRDQKERSVARPRRPCNHPGRGRLVPGSGRGLTFNPKARARISTRPSSGPRLPARPAQSGA